MNAALAPNVLSLSVPPSNHPNGLWLAVQEEQEVVSIDSSIAPQSTGHDRNALDTH